jgi:hypothetical protein
MRPRSKRHPTKIKRANSKISLCHPNRIKSQIRKKINTRVRIARVESRLLRGSIENNVERIATIIRVINGSEIGVRGNPTLAFNFKNHQTEKIVKVSAKSMREAGGKFLPSASFTSRRSMLTIANVRRIFLLSDSLSLVTIFMPEVFSIIQS